jgi:NADH:ubiquinone oxidoreductase subunit F (NADH-binding)
MHVTRGPLLEDLVRSEGASLEPYLATGGYDLPLRIAGAERVDSFLVALERAGVRGRAGGGYPTAHKWHLVARHAADVRYFVCNARAVDDDPKVPYLLDASPHRVLEAVAVGALLCGARTAHLAVSAAAAAAGSPLVKALSEAVDAGLVDADGGGRCRVDIRIVTAPDAYIAGEETALLESIEGRRPVPRGKPPLPTSSGLFGAPTAVSNLETVLQAAYALRVGAEQYREYGTSTSPGTMIFSLVGDVRRPGLYELPLGTSVGTLVEDFGRGSEEGVKLVFPGGYESPPVPVESFDVPLAFDTIRRAGSTLGSGTVVVIGRHVAAPELALKLASRFHAASCGKCRPCKDGTERTATMLSRLPQLGQKSIDLAGRSMPQSKRRYTLTVLGQSSSTAPLGISYTDMTSGLAKIEELCEFYKYRGDCHHSTASASVIQRLITLFRDEFEQRMDVGRAGSGVAGAAERTGELVAPA